MRSMSLVVYLIDLVTKHKSGELRCSATALIDHTCKKIHGKESFELAIAHSLKNLDDTNLDVNRHICKGHFM